MPGTTIGTHMGYGYAGNYARMPDSVIMNRILKATSASVSFGGAVVLNSDNTYNAFRATDTMANFAGIAVRNVIQQTTYGVEAVYNPERPMDVLERGNVSVKCVAGTPTAGGRAYIRIALNVAFPAEVIGDLRAAADGLNTIELTNCKWATGLIGADKITELAILTRNMP